MAPNVVKIIKVARAGSQLASRLTRPAEVAPSSAWDSLEGGPPHPLRRGKQIVRRGAGVGVLLFQSVLGAVILIPLMILLVIGVIFFHSAVAGWLLAITVLAGIFGLIWNTRRATQLLQPSLAAEPALAYAPTADDEQKLLELMKQQRALPAAGQAALQRAVLATRDALRATAEDQGLSREAFDAQQAAREDLLGVVSHYRRAPSLAGAEDQLCDQLGLIEHRMQHITDSRQQEQQLQWQAQEQYLREKYGDER